MTLSILIEVISYLRKYMSFIQTVGVAQRRLYVYILKLCQDLSDFSFQPNNIYHLYIVPLELKVSTLFFLPLTLPCVMRFCMSIIRCPYSVPGEAEFRYKIGPLLTNPIDGENFI